MRSFPLPERFVYVEWADGSVVAELRAVTSDEAIEAARLVDLAAEQLDEKAAA